MGTHPIFESDFDCLTAWVEKESDRGRDRVIEDVDPVPDHAIESGTDLAIVKEDDRAIETEIVDETDLLKERDLLISKKRSKLKKNSTEDKSKPENGAITFSAAIETSKMRR